jgi:hypothetical protein
MQRACERRAAASRRIGLPGPLFAGALASLLRRFSVYDLSGLLKVHQYEVLRWRQGKFHPRPCYQVSVWLLSNAAPSQIDELWQEMTGLPIVDRVVKLKKRTPRVVGWTGWEI